MPNSNPQTIYLKDYTVPEYLIEQVALSFDLDAEKTSVVAKLTLLKNPQSQCQDNRLILSGEGLKLEHLAMDGIVLNKSQYQQTNTALLIDNVPQNRVFKILIKNTITPKSNTTLEGLYLSNTMLCTQCEAEGFRKITYFLDRPDVMSQFKTTLIGNKDKYPVLLSNGNKVAAGELENNRHWVTWEDPFKKPCYLFALVAGQLENIEDSFISMSGRQISLQIFVEQADIDKCDHAMQSLKNSMAWDEQTYAREYDLDLYMIVAVGHFNMGAMENKGLNIFNTKYVLARPDTATDQDYEYIEGVIGHEYFHNWTGNRITCRDWFQLSLKEGLTVFRDQQFSAEQTSQSVKRITDVKLLRAQQFAEDAGPLSHPIRPESYIEINNFYTLTVYEKGAEVVRMIQTLVGKKGFRKGSDLYFQRHDGQAVTCDDFVSAMEAANDIDLGLFRNWYSQAGTPLLEIKEDYNQQNKTLSLNIKQSCVATAEQTTKKLLHIPVKLGLLAADGSAARLHIKDAKPCDEIVLELKKQQQTFVFEQLNEQPVVSILREFSAPVKLKMEQSMEQLAFLLSYDTDTFNRWDAGQKMSEKTIFDLIRTLQQNKEMRLNPLLLKAYKKVIESPSDDLCYFSLLLNLPEESYLAGQMEVIDVEHIHQAREFVKLSLARELKTQFQSLYQRYHKEEAQFNATEVGQRRIKNICLGYLNCLETKESYQLAEKQFATATNMTDQIAALAVIVESQNPAKKSCLQSFYQQWQDEALVIDKWFALQAGSYAAETFSNIQILLQHSAFELTNPNRVRALISTFSQANPLHFHQSNGQGYFFLADQIIALDKLNPQLAARMVSALTTWKRYDANRQKLMKIALNRIINTASISKNVYEIVLKSLECA